MIYTRSHHKSLASSPSRPFFSRSSGKGRSAPFFSSYFRGIVQRTVESAQMPEEEEPVQRQAEENAFAQEAIEEEEEALQTKAGAVTPIQRLCAKCEQEETTLQPQLTVGPAHDAYEEEADRVADHVTSALLTSGANRAQTQVHPPAITPLVMRQGEGTVTPSPQVEQGIQQSRGGGEAIASPLRQGMEQAFRADFSNVRVHTNSEADQLNQSLKARAFTTGSDIYFKGGEYQPSNPTGQRLLAHELTHIVQQSHGRNLIQRLIRTPYPWRGLILPAIGANVRSSPNSSDPTNILDSIPQGQTVQVLSSSGNWLRVESRYRGSPLLGHIHHTLVDDATSSSMTASVGTTMVWRPSGPGSGTTFESWASAATETPFPTVTSTTIMNCWEAVLLSAYRAGAINWNWIHNLYTSTPIRNWVSSMTRGTRRNYAIPGPNLTMPQRGDLVFFDGLAHIALATGNGSDVYTFWPPPNTPFGSPRGTPDQVKVFTIEALVLWWAANMPPQPIVEFAAPAW